MSATSRSETDPFEREAEFLGHDGNTIEPPQETDVTDGASVPDYDVDRPEDLTIGDTYVGDSLGVFESTGPVVVGSQSHAGWFALSERDDSTNDRYAQSSLTYDLAEWE